MIGSNLITGTILLSLTGPGIGGNFFLLVKHVHIFVMGPKKKPIDLILIHLAFANAMTLCIRALSEVISAFHFSNVLGNFGCKATIYLRRVARGLSICTTCLLTLVQAGTISPRITFQRKLKPWTAWQVLSCLLFFWIFNFFISSNLLHYITTVNSMNRSEIGPYIVSCYLLPSKQVVKWLFLSLMALRDIIFQSLMGWSSGYMALHLYNHHKRVLYLQSFRFTKKASPEIRATQSTLILMTCFLFFYWADFIFSFYIGSTLKNDSVMLSITLFLELSYASLSPFILMGRDSTWLTAGTFTEKLRKVFSALTPLISKGI
uniref:Vomeronasal type-1 receptor n=1 Tax=Microcebus murinus TaxID=30608 RepID=I7CDZ5_MICMU|nr:vomeronasal 1 receptor VN1R-Mmur048 [Microcebus murinus]